MDALAHRDVTPASAPDARPLDVTHASADTTSKVAGRGEATCPHGESCAGCGVERCKRCGAAACRIALAKGSLCGRCTNTSAGPAVIAGVELRRPR